MALRKVKIKKVVLNIISTSILFNREESLFSNAAMSFTSCSPYKAISFSYLKINQIIPPNKVRSATTDQAR
tara:strand:+ start:201 stop:413 length:213 start_codon:yes stop_codon:yes gene_type:complete